MKKISLSFILIAILGGIVVSAPVTRAEDSTTKTNATEQGAADAQKKRPSRLEVLDKALTLTDEQKMKIKAIYADQNKETKALRESANGDRKAFAEGVRKLSEDTNKKIKDLLTPDQQTKFAKFLEDSKQRAPKKQTTTE